MPYKERKRHNERRRKKRMLDAIESRKFCIKCGNKQAYFLTADDITKMTTGQIKKLQAICLNCFTEGERLWLGNKS